MIESPSSTQLRQHDSEQAAALLFGSLPTTALASGAGFINNASAMLEPPEELVAVAIGSVSRWQQHHLDAVRSALLALLT